MVRSRRDAPNTRARRRSDVYAARNTEIRCERLAWRARQAEDVVDHQGAIAGDVEQFTNHLLDANRTSAHADKCYHDDTPGRWGFPNSRDLASKRRAPLRAVARN